LLNKKSILNLLASSLRGTKQYFKLKAIGAFRSTSFTMTYIILFFILFGFSVEITAQSNRFLSLDIERISTTKRIKFYEKDKISLKIKGSKHKIKGIIVSINDTSIFIDSTETVLIKNIRKILVDKSNYLTHAASIFISGCGVGYVGLDALNNVINNDKPILRCVDVQIGLGLLAVGQAFRIFSIKRYTINKKHRLKFIDDTP